MSFKIKEIRWENVNLIPKLRANLFLIVELIKENNWEIIKYHDNNFILNLKKGKIKMNVYLSTLTIQTSMNHPTKGKTQLNRKNLKHNELKLIFQNPRSHTGKGYYKSK